MILSIDSSLETFKRVEFQKGLNVLLSESHLDASDKKTRNSAGKTSLIEIIHFLLGANCDKKSLFRIDELIDHSFMGEFDFWGKKLSVERSGSQPSRIFLLEGFDARDDLPIKQDKGKERPYLSNENWKKMLGHILFGLPEESDGTIYEQSYTPTFRSMFSYFVRRQNSGAFISPERQAENQQRWDWQENLSFLFALDWRIAHEFQKVKVRENALVELKKAANSGALGDIIGTVAELRSEVTVAEKKAERRKQRLDSFQVHDFYNELSTRAASAKSEMQSLSRKTIGLRETLIHLNNALASEAPPDPILLEKVYASAGVELPSVALKRLGEVKDFYESVVENRALHLEQEISQVTEKIADNESRVAGFDGERQGILQILKSRGALEGFITLQKELAELEAEAANLRERFKAAELLEGEKTQLDIDRSNLHRRLQQDFQERKALLDEAILLVTEAITELYDDREGRFEISTTDSGPDFRISIEGDRGGGIANMEIFCLDLALLKLNAAKSRSPGFLVHDSHLYDGVDERQIARALTLGAEATRENDLQYIVTMNSDIFDRLPLPSSIVRDEVVLGTRLSDETESGGLFGFRFD